MKREQTDDNVEREQTDDNVDREQTDDNLERKQTDDDVEREQTGRRGRRSITTTNSFFLTKTANDNVETLQMLCS